MSVVLFAEISDGERVEQETSVWDQTHLDAVCESDTRELACSTVCRLGLWSDEKTDIDTCRKRTGQKANTMSRLLANT